MAQSGRDSKSVKNNKQIIRRTWFLFAVCGLLAFIVSVLCLGRLALGRADTGAAETPAEAGPAAELPAETLRGSIYDSAGAVLAFEDTSGGAAVRVYPGGTLACHVLGAVLEGDYGPAGLETSYSEALSAGQSLTLTLNSELQALAEASLQKTVRSAGAAQGGCVIIMEAATGKILALASLDNFDCADYTTISDETRARLNEQADESGSAAREELIRAAMERQWVNLALESSLPVGDWLQPFAQALLWEEGLVSHDILTAGDAASESGVSSAGSLTAVAEALEQARSGGAGDAYISQYAAAFGWGELCAADLPCAGGAVSAALTAEEFHAGACSVSPLQLVSAFAALVNDGARLRPYLVQSVTDPQGGLIEGFEPVVCGQAVSASTSALCRRLLAAAVEDASGAAGNARVAGYTVGALVADLGAGDSRVSLSLSYAEDTQNGPLVMLYALYGAPGETTASQSAAPAGAELLTQALSLRGAPRTYTDTEIALLDVRVPSVCGMTLSAAREALSAYGLEGTAADYTAGSDGDDPVVVAQLPAEGAEVAGYSCVRLYTATPADIGTVEVPSLQGLTYAEALAALSQRGLFLACGGSMLPYAGTRVTAQSEPAGAQVSAGTVISVTLRFSAE